MGMDEIIGDGVQPVIKRMFDILLALAGLILLFPLMAFAALLIKGDSKGAVFFKQERIGRGFRPFLIYKFRTMRESPHGKGPLVTVGQDPRITRVGWFLRKTKIDEIPQLINVLNGDMSFVGPRPEVRQYVEFFQREYEEILTVRPGITDLASLKYRDEAALLGKAADPEKEYVTRVLPDKIRLAKDYVHHSSFLFDLSLIFKTILKLFDYRMSH
jgi:lipopolysaccharide/colanic/teichoic acid biosynthesis glycosyltransferase